MGGEELATFPYDRENGATGGAIVKAEHAGASKTGPMVYLYSQDPVEIVLQRVPGAGGIVATQRVELPNGIGAIALIVIRRAITSASMRWNGRMRRADRLFQIVQHLRARRLTTAAQLAELLEVSERTIYRAVRDLSISGVPVEGEAGVGYRIHPSFELTPLMFSTHEIEALVAGARMVEAFTGPS